MKKLLLSIAAAAAVVSCTVIDNLKGLPTAEADSYARALEHVAKHLDTGEFKIHHILFSEGEALSDRLFFVSVSMIDRDDRTFTQTFYLDGRAPGNLSADNGIRKPEYETTVGIDLASLDPQQIAAQIAEARTTLPEGYTFKSVSMYEVTETIPSGNALLDRGKQFGTHETRFVMNFTEDGKEKVSSAGQTSLVYYQATASVAPDGTITVEAD